MMESLDVVRSSAEPQVPNARLSYQQRCARRLADEGRARYIQIVLELIGPLDMTRLRDACAAHVARHTILQRSAAPAWSVCDLSAVMPDFIARHRGRCANACGRGLARALHAKVFDAVLLRSTASRHDLVLTFSSVAADAATLRQSCHDILDLYHRGRPHEPPLPYATLMATTPWAPSTKRSAMRCTSAQLTSKTTP